jgi:hypothetical protein
MAVRNKKPLFGLLRHSLVHPVRHHGKQLPVDKRTVGSATHHRVETGPWRGFVCEACLAKMPLIVVTVEGSRGGYKKEQKAAGTVVQP